jgi:hypothetical protein
MQDDAQNILLEIKHDIMDGQTFFPFSLRRIEWETLKHIHMPKTP